MTKNLYQKNENPAARRSKAALMYAFTELLTQKDISEITISEITDKAGLSRQAFYTNFSKKEDILDDMIRRLFEIYREECPQTARDPLAVLENYFNFWESHKTSLTVLFASSLGYLFLARNTDLFHEELGWIAKLLSGEEQEIPYIKSCLSGITYNLLKTWIMQNEDLNAQQLMGIVKHLLKGMLENGAN